MPIEELNQEQRTVLASYVLQILAELWGDQQGVDAVIRVVPKGDT